MSRSGRAPDEQGEALAFVIVWPVLSTFILLMIVHAFIVSSARAEAETAVSEGLRAIWRQTAVVHPSADVAGEDINGTVLMADAARDAVARVARGEGGWRWWRPSSAADQCRGDDADADCAVVRVYSDWCIEDTALRPGGDQHEGGPGGWVRVEIAASVVGPLASVWPGRLDHLHKFAEGPAVLRPPDDPNEPEDLSDEVWIQPDLLDDVDKNPHKYRCG